MDNKLSICIAGAGTMGAGIAICALQYGIKVILLDPREEALLKAKEEIEKKLIDLEAKGKFGGGISALSATASLTITSTWENIRFDVLIEAIVEDLTTKQTLFSTAYAQSPDAFFCTNTSSISIDAIAGGFAAPERLVGLHFFNPAPVMKLVEVVAGKGTNEETILAATNLAMQLGKTPVQAKDSPGFIVNRVARPYYLEAMYTAAQTGMPYTDIDRLMEAQGFKMGPFALMDMIGLDINLATSRIVYDELNHQPHLEPSLIQANLVAQGKLGKKTGEGFYMYVSKR